MHNIRTTARCGGAVEPRGKAVEAHFWEESRSRRISRTIGLVYSRTAEAVMSLFGATTLFGAASGLLIRVWANGLGKQRLFARPWNHVLFIGVGGYIGYHYPRWEEELLVSVNEKRAERGMPTITRQNITLGSVALSSPTSTKSEE